MLEKYSIILIEDTQTTIYRPESVYTSLVLYVVSFAKFSSWN